MKTRYNHWDFESMRLKINEICGFASPMDEIELGNYLKLIEEEGYDLSIVRVNEEDRETRNTLESFGFKMKEITHEISCKNIKYFNLKPNKKCSIKQDCKTVELLSIVDGLFKHGRFVEDPSIPTEKSNSRNLNWTLQILNDDTVIKKYLYYNDKPVGFMFYVSDENSVDLILGGVSERYQHLSYYFWEQIFLINKDKRFRTSISASNLGALNLYLKFGFEVKKIKIGYHKKIMNKIISSNV